MKNQCKSCGYTNIDEAIFCATCGEKIVQKVETYQTYSLTLKSGLIYLSLILLSYSFTGIFLDLVYAMLNKYPVSFVVESIELYFYYSYAIYKLLFIVLLVYIIRVLLIKNGKYSEKLFIVLIIAISFIFHIIYFQYENYTYAESIENVKSLGDEENTTKQSEIEKVKIAKNKTEIIEHELARINTLEKIEKYFETYRLGIFYMYDYGNEQDINLDYLVVVGEKVDLYLYKFNKEGHLLWKKRLETNGERIGFTNITVHDDSYYVFVSLSGNLTMIQLDQKGNEILRTKREETHLCNQAYTNMKHKKDYWFTIDLDDNKAKDFSSIVHGVLVCSIFPESYTSIYIKIDNKGNKLWDVRGEALQEIQDGYIVADNKGQKNGFTVSLVRLDDSGKKIWEKVLHDNYVRDMVANKHSVVLAGYTENRSLKVIKVNNDGEIIWTKVLSDKEIDSRRVFIQKTNDGNYLVFSDHRVINLNKNGEKLWDKELGANIEIEHIHKISSHIFALRGIEKYNQEKKKWKFILDVDTFYPSQSLHP